MSFWRSLFRSRAVRISLAAILLVPLLYSYLYLWAFWDPYGRLSDLPVAVVNEDRGASYMGETVNIGAELIDKLLDDPVMNWVFLSRREADQALEDGRVYLALIIPPDFSARAVRVDDPQALRAALVLKTNPAQNLLASQIGESAVRQLRQKLSETLTERFVAAILETVEKGAAGLDTAADAARQLENGTRQAKSGAHRLAGGAHEL
ncbi:YhgE/Pip domain-containing protein, partial [Calditerricola satsumensis]